MMMMRRRRKKRERRITFTTGKSKGQPITSPEGTEGEERYSSTLSLTSALDREGG